MKKNFLLFLLIFYYFHFFGQNSTFEKIELKYSISGEKEFEEYDKYTINSFDIFVGRNKNGCLEYVITSKKGNILERKCGIDVMQFKPTVFENKSSKTTLIFIEYATEFSWGNAIYKIQNEKFHKIGWINYAIVVDNGESIADYCRINSTNKGIEIKFENVKLYESTTEEVIDGENIVFLIKRNKLKTTIKTNS